MKVSKLNMPKQSKHQKLKCQNPPLLMVMNQCTSTNSNYETSSQMQVLKFHPVQLTGKYVNIFIFPFKYSVFNTKINISYCNAEHYKCPPNEQYTRYDHNMAPKPWISIPNIKIYLETKFLPNREDFCILVAILDSKWLP